jgi:predicted RNase H-like HicB family nuclease
MLFYPAIFTKEGGAYWVRFPDLDGCLTEGKDMRTAVEMAQEALGGYIVSLVERKITVPRASDLSDIKADAENECIVIIVSDADKFFTRRRAVKKTLSIPAWLSEAADERHINYSSVLQEALLKQLEL